MITIKYLDWDSVFFGLKIGQAEVPFLDAGIITELKTARRKGDFDLVYLFTDNPGSEARGSKPDILPEPVDIKVTYSKTVVGGEELHYPGIRTYDGPVTGKLTDLAIESGHMSRFRKDQRLNPRFVDMYTAWISGSVSGELADAVLVSEDQDDINGFITLKKNGPVCTVGLIAVDSMSRGRGIGGGLLKEAAVWSFEKDCHEIRVATQTENQGACRLYEKNGYSVMSVKYIFHI